MCVHAYDSPMTPVLWTVSVPLNPTMNLSVTWSPSAGEKCEQQIFFPFPFGERGDISADVLSVFQTQRGETWFGDRKVYVGTGGSYLSICILTSHCTPLRK